MIHWIMNLRHSLKKHARRAILPLSICALIVYFVVQLYVGDTGLPTHVALRDQLAEATTELAELQEKRQEIEQNLTLIDPRDPMPPLLEEIARDKLKLVDPDEVVVLQR